MAEILYEDGSKDLKSHAEMLGYLRKESAPSNVELLFTKLIEKAIEEKVKSITLHKPGEIVEKDGKAFMVTESGDWRECVRMVNGEVYIVGADGKLNLYKTRDC